MKALRIDKPGGTLVLDQVPVPEPGPGQVLVKMGMAPINPSDLATLSSGYLAKNWPLTPGLEGAGQVVKVGPGLLPALRKGKRVACSPLPGGDGTWAEFLCTSVTRVSPLPASLPLEQGAMMLVNPLTAMALLRIAREGRHKAVLNNAAGSALGKMLIGLFRKEGIPLINVVRRAEQVKELKTLGASWVLCSSDETYQEVLQTHCQELGVSLLLDAVGGSESARLLAAAPVGARLLVYARLSGDQLQLDPSDLMQLEKEVAGFQLGNWLHGKNLFYKMRLLHQVGKGMGNLLASNVARHFPLAEAEQAIGSYRENMSAGKVLLVADSSMS